MELRVLTDVVSPNVADVEINIDEATPTVYFTAHPHGGPEACWFSFRIVSSEPGRPVRLVLKHPENLLGAKDIENIRPVFRYSDSDSDSGSGSGSGSDRGGAPWRRMGGGRPVELEDGRVWCEWIVDFPCPSAEVAACYPYATKEVTRLVSETGGYWRSDTIGVSQQGRPLTRLSNHTGAEEQSERKPGLYLVARQHSGETPGSWVLDGLLRELARTDESRYLVWTVPLTNIDGVVQGDYGKDNYPYDLNRAWGHPPMRHETLVFQRDFRLFRRRCVPVALIDFHAPGLADSDGAFAFGLDYEDPLRRNRQHRLLQVLGDALGSLACDEFDRRAAYASRWNTPWAAEFAKSRGCIGFSIETPYQAAGDRVFTQELYREAGALIARGLSNLVPNLLDPT